MAPISFLTVHTECYLALCFQGLGMACVLEKCVCKKLVFMRGWVSTPRLSDALG